MSALTRWNPFRREEGLELWEPFRRWAPLREMDEVMDRMLTGWPFSSAETREAMTMAEWAPRADIIEDENEYLVKAELPEVKKEDLKVRVDDGVLSIKGERKMEKEEKGKKYRRIERAYGSFERRFTLPEDADPKQITSEFKDGVLKVHLHKNPEMKPKSTEIAVQ